MVSDDLPALVARAQQADGEAWEVLYRRAYPRLLAYARRRLPAGDAEEAVSETMARAVASVHRFTPKGHGFEGWLFGICRHVVLDQQRAAGRRSRNDSRIRPEPWSGDDLTDDLLAREEADAVRRAFTRLRAKDQELLELRVVAGLSSEDTAATLGKRPGATRMAQVRALARLRRILEEDP